MVAPGVGPGAGELLPGGPLGLALGSAVGGLVPGDLEAAVALRPSVDVAERDQLGLTTSAGAEDQVSARSDRDDQLAVVVATGGVCSHLAGDWLGSADLELIPELEADALLPESEECAAGCCSDFGVGLGEADVSEPDERSKLRVVAVDDVLAALTDRADFLLDGNDVVEADRDLVESGGDCDVGVVCIAHCMDGFDV